MNAALFLHLSSCEPGFNLVADFGFAYMHIMKNTRISVSD
ncbi:unnamed protein product [Musa acuminata subsp. malaccensis]|uniref:(wild Malaysian banana) hypothetical protein n=1 Tax=Musa acuminata subsp. malaccensis TaxID=214687 RepID=A0A804IU39_MUSAM|nr:unnamed protein product [Musa acuminata subsp. malaccensis]